MKNKNLDIEMNAKYIEELVEKLQLGKKTSQRKLPCSADGGQRMKEAKNGEVAECGRIPYLQTGILLCLAPERPDICSN